MASSEGEELQVLFHAAKLGRTDIIQSVITSIKKQKKDLNISEFISSIDNDGNTSLHIASHFGRSDVVRALLNFGGDPSILPTKGEFAGKSAYEVAFDGVLQTFHVYTFEQIALGHLESLKLLLKGKIPIDLHDDSATKDSTLHWACSFDQYLVAEYLLQQNINVDITNALGQSCLHIACKSGKNNFIDLLLDHGANISLKDSSGKTPIDLYPLNLPQNPRLLQNVESTNLTNTNSSNPVINEKSLLNNNSNNNNNNNNSNINHSNSNSNINNSHHSDNSNENHQNTSSISNKNNLVVDIHNHNVNNNEDKSVDHNSDSGYDTDTSDEFKLNYLRQLKRSSNPLNDEENRPIKQLILWPPVQRQIQYPRDSNSSSSLIFSSDTPIIICAATDDIDIYPLLTWSGLIDTLNNLGLQTYVHRSTTFGKIRFTIDPILCPGRHRYEILINSSEANLIASDSTGLLYAVHTFVQIIQLHSDFVTSNDNSNINTVIIPPMKIIDWPDVLNRGIMWSYRRSARTTSSSMKSLIRLYSALRINQLFLLIDSKDSNTTQLDSIQVISSKICSLDEISKRHCVELIPVITISHLEEKFPIDTLRNFSHQSIAIVLNLSNDISHELWIEKYRELLLDSLKSGHCYVTLVCNNLFKNFQQIIQHISLEVGIYVQHYTPQIFFPSRYILKSLTSSQHMAVHALAQAKDVYEHGSTLSIYPAMSESDFLYPNILYKHISYLHAGASWNRNAFEEILGNGLLDDHSMLRPSLKFLLFSQTGNHEEERFKDLILDLFTTQFTNGISCTTFEDVARVENYLWTFLSSSQYPNDVVIPFSKEEVIECLKTFRTILTASGWKINSQSQSNLRSENNNSASAQQLNQKNNKNNHNADISNTSQNNLSSSITQNNENQSQLFKETEEFLHILHLISILCRCFVFAWNSYDKIHHQSHLLSNSNNHHQNHSSNSSSNNNSNNNGSNHHLHHDLLTIDSLIRCLTPGSASDVANMILEGVTVCYHHIWQKKFESFHMRHGFHSLGQSSSFQLYKSNDESEEHHHHHHSHSNKNIMKKAGRYLRNIDNQRYSQITKIELPFRCIFQNICKHMPNYSIDVLYQTFEGSTISETNHSSIVTPLPSPQSQQQSQKQISTQSSWSLWKR